MGRIGIPLSGGLDSRTVLGVVRELKPADKLWTFSVGHRHTYDVVFGRRMARICRTRHQFIPLEQDFMARRGGTFVWLTDGMVNAHHCWQMGATEVAPAMCDHVLLGFLGGPLSGFQPRVKPVLQATNLKVVEDQFVWACNVVFSDEELGVLLRPSVYAQLRGAASEDLRQGIRMAAAEELADRTRVVNLLQDEQRHTWYYFAMYGSRVSMSAPFTDNDVVDFFLTVPVRYRSEQQVHQELIRRYLPALAHVALDKSGLPLDASRRQYVWHRRWRRLVTEQLPRWTGGQYTWHDRRAYAHYGQWMCREPMRSFLEQAYARGERYLAEWCDVSQARALLRDHLDGKVDAYGRISALLTLMLWSEAAEAVRPVSSGEGATFGTRLDAETEASPTAPELVVNVSVILPSRNRAASLKEALVSVTQQATKSQFNYEVVVVDNGSTDETRETVSAIANGSPVPLRYLHEPTVGKPFAANSGIAAARGEVCVFTDDDVVAERTWLLELWRCLRESGAEAVAGRVLPLWVHGRPQWLTDTLLQQLGALGLLDFGEERLSLHSGEGHHWWVGSNLAITRKTIERAGCFDRRCYRSEDRELFQRYCRAGARIVYEPGAVVYHKVGRERLTPAYFRRWYDETGYYRAHAVEWKRHHALTLMPLYCYRDILRLAYQWARSTVMGETFWRRLTYECRLRASLSLARHRLQLWPRWWVSVLTGRSNGFAAEATRVGVSQ